MKNILVTGGAGFIGSHFIERIHEKYKKIVCVDKLTYAGNMKNLRFPVDMAFYKADIVDREKMRLIFSQENIDTVVNFAAESISEDTYIPIKSALGIKTKTFGELWSQMKGNNKIENSEKGEVIFPKGKYTKVLSFLNGGQWMPIKAITRHWYKGKIVRLVQKNGIIEATPNHSLYSSNLELSNPSTNPELLTINNVNGIKKNYLSVDKRTLSFLAAYITEGSLTHNKSNGSYLIQIGQKNKEWLQKVGNDSKSYFSNIKFNICGDNEKSGDVFNLQISNKKLYEFLYENCGRYSKNKCFPNWIFDLKSELKEYFFECLKEGDGTIDNRYTTTSFKLANQISLLLVLLNKRFTINERVFDNPKHNTAWDFRVDRNNHYGLNKKIKTEIDYEGWVYDLEIEKTHNFVCGLGNVVCHNTHVDRSIKEPRAFIETDILGLFNLVQLSRKCGVKRFIHISTDEVYGVKREGVSKETDKLDPTSPYSASKASADLLLNAYRKTYDFPVIIIRPTNNYGPRQYPEKLIPMSITRMLDNKPILMHGDGDEIREWLYVKDTCGAIEGIMLYGKLGEIYNVGSGFRKTNHMVISSILKEMLSFDEFHFCHDWIKSIPNRPGNDHRYAVNIIKTLHLLGNYSKTTFKEGLVKTVWWYKENRDYWEDVDIEANIYRKGEYLR